MKVVGIDASNIRAGGGITHLRELLTAASPVEDEFETVVVWASQRTLDALPDRPWLRKVRPPELDGNLLSRTLWQARKLGRAARKVGCDVLFVPGGSFVTRFRPIVTMNQNLLPFQWKELRRYGLSAMTLKLIALRLSQSRSFRQADETIFLTEAARDVVAGVCGPMPGNQPIVPHGIDRRFLTPPRPPRALAACSDKDPFRVIYVSPVEPYKHQWHVAEAVASLCRQGLPITIDFVGPANAKILPRLTATMLGVDPAETHIRYRGPVPYDSIHAAYANADLAVFASSCETIGNVLIEGMAAGLATAASDIGPVREVLGDAGTYFDPEKPQQIAAAIMTLATSTELRRTKALLAYSRASQYSWNHCARSTFKVLAETAARRPGSTPSAR